VSHTVFANCLNVTPNLVSQWGEKKSCGPASRRLRPVEISYTGEHAARFETEMDARDQSQTKFRATIILASNSRKFSHGVSYNEGLKSERPHMKKALLVIDAQKVYTTAGSELFCPDSEATIARINALIEKFRSSGEPIIYIRHIHKADGSDLGRMFDFLGEWDGKFNFKEDTEEVEYDDRLLSPNGAVEITKSRYSSFVNTPLQRTLENFGVDTVVVSGFMTNFCCDCAAREAHDRDYYVEFVIDATGTPGTARMDEAAVRNAEQDFLGAGFARVLTTYELLRDQTLQKAQTPALL
jgi:nicotinamidase-related amidase